MDVRVGIGFDVHRLAEGRRLVLGGLEIESPVGLAGHSDADVVLHAITDAILGAAGQGDIGEYFPDTDPTWKDAASKQFVEHAVEVAATCGMAVGNVDVNVIADKPRLGPAKQAIRKRLAELLGLSIDRVNVKARTMEGLGPVGEGKAIACQAVVTLIARTP
jgi:2-C-methyl-D-erythritol 2,4-cyclodiphosphate synthase